MMKLLTIATITVLSIPLQLTGTTIDLDFSTLPSAQGWTFITQDPLLTESTVFSVAGGRLLQNTIGIGEDVAHYDRTGVNLYDPSLPFELSLNAQVLREEVFPPPDISRGLYFGVTFDHLSAAFGIGPDRVSYSSFVGGYFNVPFDAHSASHTYTLRWDPTAGLFSYLIDGSSIASAPGDVIRYPGTIPPYIFFGDERGNAEASISSMEFTQAPEPATGWLVSLVAAAGFVAMKLRAAR